MYELNKEKFAEFLPKLPADWITTEMGVNMLSGPSVRVTISLPASVAITKGLVEEKKE